jgi:hypothetical protein
MALEHVSGELEAAGSDTSSLKGQLKIINDHRKHLESSILKGSEPDISRTVNATIQQATEHLWKTVGGEMRVKKFTDKIVRLGANWALERAQELKEKMDTLRATEGKLKKVVARARKKLVRREINDLQSAIVRAKLSPNLSEAAEGVLDQALQAMKEGQLEV